jgi:phytoene synthase
MSRALRALEEPYRSRAIPAGSIRHWSWLFAAAGARDALLGVYALVAEWRALLDPATELHAAQLKLAWWQEELGRAASGGPLHPITRYLAATSGSRMTAVSALTTTLDSTAAQLMGAPLESAADLPAHAQGLYGLPLLTAARLAGSIGADRIADCVSAFSIAHYLARTLTEYRREVRAGRMPFPVAELLGAGIENDDLAAAAPTPRLQAYLTGVRQRAADGFAAADAALGAPERHAHRHLAVLIGLSVRDLKSGREPGAPPFRLGDLYHAWQAARRAAAGRRLAP